MLLLPNTKENRAIASVAATMAIEGMPLSYRDVIDMMRVMRGETTTEQLRRDLIAQLRSGKLKEPASRTPRRAPELLAAMQDAPAS